MTLDAARRHRIGAPSALGVRTLIPEASATVQRCAAGNGTYGMYVWNYGTHLRNNGTHLREFECVCDSAHCCT